MSLGTFTGCETQKEAAAKDGFILEAIHLNLLRQFGDSYGNSEAANMMRQEIYDKTGREAK